MTPTDAVRTRTSRYDPPRSRFARRGLVPAAVLASTLGASSFAGASTPQPVVSSAKIAGLGTVLVSAQRPLYESVSDPRGHSMCTGGCATIWPPLLVSAKGAHHLGHISGLGTIHRSNGKLQVAMHGHALYFFSGDHTTSHAGGQGFENNWFTVHTNGTLDKTVVSSGPVSTVPTTSPQNQSSSSSTTTRPTSAPASPAPNNTPAPTSPPPTSPPPTTTPPTSPPPTTTPTTSPPPTTTTTTSGGGGGVGF